MNEKDKRLINKLNANIKTDGKMTDGQWTDGEEPKKAYDYGDKRNDPDKARKVLKDLTIPMEEAHPIVIDNQWDSMSEEIEKRVKSSVADGLIDILENVLSDVEGIGSSNGKYTYILQLDDTIENVIYNAIVDAIKENNAEIVRP